MTIHKYRLIDLAIFTALAMILDIILGLQGLFGVSTYLSLSIPILLLVYRRWGIYGLIPNGILAILHVFLYRDGWTISLANAIGLCTLSIALLWQKHPSMKPKYITYGTLFGFYVFSYFVMVMMEWLCLLLFGHTLSLYALLLNHSINMLLGLGLLSIIYLQNELFVPMPSYIKEISKKGCDHD